MFYVKRKYQVSGLTPPVHICAVTLGYMHGWNGRESPTSLFSVELMLCCNIIMGLVVFECLTLCLSIIYLYRQNALLIVAEGSKSVVVVAVHTHLPYNVMVRCFVLNFSQKCSFEWFWTVVVFQCFVLGFLKTHNNKSVYMHIQYNCLIIRLSMWICVVCIYCFMSS